MADDDRTKAGGRAPGKPPRPPVTIDLPAQRIDPARPATGGTRPVTTDRTEPGQEQAATGPGTETAAATGPGPDAAASVPGKPAPAPPEPGKGTAAAPSGPGPSTGAGASVRTGTSPGATPGPEPKPEPKPELQLKPEPKPGPAERPARSPGASGVPPTPPPGQQASAKPAEAGGGRSRPGVVALLAAAVIGAVIALAIGYGLQAAGVLSAPGSAAATDAQRRVGELDTEISKLREQMSALAAQPDLRPLSDRVAALEALPEQVTGLEASLQDLANQVGALPPPAPAIDPARIARLQSDVTALQQAVAAQGAAATPEDARRFTDALAAIESRLTALEQRPVPGVTKEELASVTGTVDQLRSDVAGLQSRLDELAPRIDSLETVAADQQETARTARALAVASLRSAADRGEPFAAPLAALRQLGLPEEELAPLAHLAPAGAASRQQLADRFPAVADAILAATREVNPDAGFFDRLWGNARSLVTVRPAGPVEGTTPEAIVSRMEAAVKAGDLATALGEREGLPEAGKTASADWAAAAGQRLSLDAALARLDAAATQTPAGGAGQ